MFDSFGPGVNLSGRSGGKTDRKAFLEKNKKEREARHERQRQTNASLLIQRKWRSNYLLGKVRDENRVLYDKRVSDLEKVKNILIAKGARAQVNTVLGGALQTTLLKPFLFFFSGRQEDRKRLEDLLKMLSFCIIVNSDTTQNIFPILFDPEYIPPDNTVSATEDSKKTATANNFREFFFLCFDYLNDSGNRHNIMDDEETILNYSDEILELLEKIKNPCMIEKLALCPKLFHFLRDCCNQVSGTNLSAKKERISKIFRKYSPLKISKNRMDNIFIKFSPFIKFSEKNLLLDDPMESIVDEKNEPDTVAANPIEEVSSPSSGNRFFKNYNKNPACRADSKFSIAMEYLLSLILSKGLFIEKFGGALGNDLVCKELKQFCYLEDPNNEKNKSLQYDILLALWREYLYHYISYSCLSAKKSMVYLQRHSTRNLSKQLADLWGSYEAVMKGNQDSSGSGTGNGQNGNRKKFLENESANSTSLFVAVDSKYTAGSVFQKNSMREVLKKTVTSMSKKEEITQDHPKLLLLQGYGNVLSMIKNSMTELLSNNNSVDPLYFLLMNLFSEGAGDQDNDQNSKELQGYLEGSVKRQISLKWNSEFVKQLCKNCSTDQFLMCYFGRDYTEIPPDSVLTVIAFSCSEFLAELGAKVVTKRAETWVNEIIEFEKTSGASSISANGAFTAGRELPTMLTMLNNMRRNQIRSDAISTNGVVVGTGASAASNAGANASAASTRPSNSNIDGMNRNALYIVPFSAIFRLQATVMDDSEFFSLSNPMAPILESLANLLNRFAFQFLQKIESVQSGANSIMELERLVQSKAARVSGKDGEDEDDDVQMIDDNEGKNSNFGFSDFSKESNMSPLFRLITSQVCDMVRALYDRFKRFRQEEEGNQSQRIKFNPNWTIAFSGARKSNQVLVELPHCIPFQDRVGYLQQWITYDQEVRVERRFEDHFLAGPRYNIRRSHIIQDGFSAIQGMDNLRESFKVQFIDENGEIESGIDGGGLFKEFLLELSRHVFDPDFGLFRETSDNKLVPRSFREATIFFGSPSVVEGYYKFLGQIIGKAVYENCLLEPQFSRVFLNLLLGRENTIDDLWSLDKDLARNLIYCKTNDVTDLGLTFSVQEENTMGINYKSAGLVRKDDDEIIDLLPNGRNIDVTEENKISYIQRMAYRKTTTELIRQANAFREGMLCVLSNHWLRMFDQYEVNILISGTPDLRFHELMNVCTYAGGFNSQSPIIKWFWEIVCGEFTLMQQSKLLQFVTSCSRAPLMGYASLYPPFCIHRVPDNDRLPTASTCANLLKLPDYSDKNRLRDKLLQSITQGEGFHLS